ncbi:hypothetical protein LGM71_29330 [Burkholderia sp. AU33545]|uniref:hypothetical protein n=1 Tax=Burkholderia sp. AU33545 TaxID=2879631 RepID=UPI001CF3C3BB|nr:hypothetical protein [Burkholderia sp. AU33545]MCA8205145.1 hypothetical protein [Burkholderia sp. AU33545]
MDLHQERVRAVVARAICAACGEKPERPGDARGNALRWQYYEHSADAVLVELLAAEMGEPGRSAVSHLANVIARTCEDGPDKAWMYERAASDALRAYAVC